MNFEEIKNEFDKEDDIFKLKEVKYIREHKDEMIDQLLQVIEDYTNNIDIDNDIPISVLYSLFLLSEFREQRLFPYLIKMLHYKDPKYDFFDIYGEGICENFPEFLASTFNGDIESINNVIESDDWMSGIQAISGSDNAEIIKSYDLNGRVVTSSYHGVSILKMSNGTTKKVFVK